MERYVRKSREERQQEIHRAAIQVFLEKGYKNATMEDLVKATTLSKGGLYHYYSNTRDILIDIMRLGTRSFVEQELKVALDASREEVCRTVTGVLVEKILTETPERRLFLMFAFEIIYDPQIENIYLELEQEAFALLEEILRIRIPDYDCVRKREKRLFLSRLVNALTLSQNLFSDKDICKTHEDWLFNMLYEVVNDLFA